MEKGVLIDGSSKTKSPRQAGAGITKGGENDYWLGAGESGTTPAPAVTINAVADALSDYGVLHVETPATPLRIWQAIHG